MRTYCQTKEDARLKAKWQVIDATGVPLGRLASKVATLLRGKHKPTFTPHVDGGDFVVVLNASKVLLTGSKLDDKRYFRHSGYIGGILETPARKMMEAHPERVIELAVKGMIPGGALGHQIIKKLKVYSGGEHPHAAQQPEVVEMARKA